MKALTIAYAVLFTVTFMSITYAAKEKPMTTQAKEEMLELKKNAEVKIKAAKEKISLWSESAEENAQDLTAEARAKINNNIAQLKVLSEDLEKRLDNLKDASEDKWIDAKVGFKNALNKLDAEYKKMTN